MPGQAVSVWNGVLSSFYWKHWRDITGGTSAAGRVHCASDAEGREKGGSRDHSSSLAGPRHNCSASAGHACAVPYCGRGTSSHLPLHSELGPVAGPRPSSSKRTVHDLRRRRADPGPRERAVTFRTWCNCITRWILQTGTPVARFVSQTISLSQHVEPAGSHTKLFPSPIPFPGIEASPCFFALSR